MAACPFKHSNGETTSLHHKKCQIWHYLVPKNVNSGKFHYLKSAFIYSPKNITRHFESFSARITSRSISNQACIAILFSWQEKERQVGIHDDSLQKKRYRDEDHRASEKDRFRETYHGSRSHTRSLIPSGDKMEHLKDGRIVMRSG